MKPPGTPGSAWRDALMGEDFGSRLESCDPDKTSRWCMYDLTIIAYRYPAHNANFEKHAAFELTPKFDSSQNRTCISYYVSFYFNCRLLRQTASVSAFFLDGLFA